MVKVRPQMAPVEQPSVNLVAARNEFVSFQVGLHGGPSGWPGVSVSLPALEGPALIEGTDIVLYRQTFLDITQVSTQVSEPGRWPDGLVPDVDESVWEKRRAFPMDVPAGESRAVWVDVHVPLDAPPGLYQGVVEVTGEGYSARVLVYLSVVDAELPSTSSIRSSFFLFNPTICVAFTGQRDCSLEDQKRLLAHFHKLALEHRITLGSRFDPYLTPHWDTLAEWWSPFIDGTAPLRLPGARMTSLEAAGEFSLGNRWDFSSWAGASAWLPIAFNNIGDEPPWHNTLEEIHANILEAEQTPRLRTFLTTSVRMLKLEGLMEEVDSLGILVNVIEGGNLEERVARLAEYTEFLSIPGKELWLYVSCESQGCNTLLRKPQNQPGQGWPSYVIDTSAAKNRALEWVSFMTGATGELYYETGLMMSSAWTDQWIYGGNGDGTLFYPGTVATIGGTSDVPLPSLRLKLIRLGMQDYEWLKKVSDAGDPEFARAVARELIPYPWLVPDDGALFERARLRLIRRYLELTQGEIPPELREEPVVPCLHQ